MDNTGERAGEGTAWWFGAMGEAGPCRPKCRPPIEQSWVPVVGECSWPVCRPLCANCHWTAGSHSITSTVSSGCLQELHTKVLLTAPALWDGSTSAALSKCKAIRAYAWEQWSPTEAWSCLLEVKAPTWLLKLWTLEEIMFYQFCRLVSVQTWVCFSSLFLISLIFWQGDDMVFRSVW